MTKPNLAAEDVRAAFDASDTAFLGRGTFGETWRVDTIDVAGKPTVCAVEFLDPKNFNAGLVQREIDGLTVVHSSRFARLHDVRDVDVAGVTHTTLVCEYLPGGDVAANVAEFGLPSHQETLAFAVELLHGVKQLHTVERVHRDLKPANIILRDGRWDSPVLIDMGLSKGASDLTMTVYPQRVGSLIYFFSRRRSPTDGAQPKSTLISSCRRRAGLVDFVRPVPPRNGRHWPSWWSALSEGRSLGMRSGRHSRICPCPK